MTALLLPVLAMFLVSAAQVGAAMDPVATAFAEVGATLQRSPEVKGRKIGVGDFPLTDNRVTELGTHLADQLETALVTQAAAGGFEVIARSQLCQVIRENRLWLGDQFDPALHKKLGRLSQADLLATGRLTDRGNQLAVSLRILDTETARVVWADSLSLLFDEALRALMRKPVGGDGCGGAAPPKEQPVTAPPVGPAGSSPQAEDRLEVKVWAGKPSYKIGETASFGLRVNRDAYVTLIDIGTSGEVTVIYPNRFHPSHFVPAGQDVLIPPADAAFRLVVNGPSGFDQIRAIATQEQVKFQAEDFRRPGVTFRSLDRVETRGLSVQIREERERIQQVSPTKWAEQVIAVEVKP